MQETLICREGNHKWDRERKRGVKPAWCPAHKPEKPVSNSGKGNVQPGNSESTGTLSEPLSVVSDEALEILTSDNPLRPEFERKLSYCVDQLERGRTDLLDIELLKQTRDRLVAQHKNGRVAA